MGYRRAKRVAKHHHRISKSQLEARNALYEWDRQEMNALRVWLADNAWILLGTTEEEWHERESGS